MSALSPVAAEAASQTYEPGQEAEVAYMPIHTRPLATTRLSARLSARCTHSIQPLSLTLLPPAPTCISAWLSALSLGQDQRYDTPRGLRARGHARTQSRCPPAASFTSLAPPNSSSGSAKSGLGFKVVADGALAHERARARAKHSG